MHQLVIGIAVSLANIAVHSIAMTGVIFVFKRREAARSSFGRQLHLVVLMIAVVTVLNAAHLIEVAIWALVYGLLGIGPESTSSFYFALVNFTTLGYGDVVPVARWQWIGPLTAMNGVLLLGWSTAVIFAVLSSQGLLSSTER